MTMNWMHPALCAALAFAMSARSSAQTGSASGVGYSTSTTELTARVEISYLRRTQWDASRRSEWIPVILLWRGQPGWADHSDDSPRRRQAIDAYRKAQAAGILANAAVLGGRHADFAFLAQVDSDFTSVTLLGRHLALPLRDSALVVMIDRVDGTGGPPSVVGTVVVDGRLETRPSTRPPRLADTTAGFAAVDDVVEQLKAMLSRDPTVAAFWR